MTAAIIGPEDSVPRWMLPGDVGIGLQTHTRLPLPGHAELHADWWLFTSARAVQAVSQESWLAAGKPKLAAVGDSTAQAICAQLSVTTVLTPHEAPSAQTLAQTLIDSALPAQALWFCGVERSQDLTESLRRAGWSVQPVEVYDMVTRAPSEHEAERTLTADLALVLNAGSLRHWPEHRPRTGLSVALGERSASVLRYRQWSPVEILPQPNPETWFRWRARRV